MYNTKHQARIFSLLSSSPAFIVSWVFIHVNDVFLLTTFTSVYFSFTRLQMNAVVCIWFGFHARYPKTPTPLNRRRVLIVTDTETRRINNKNTIKSPFCSLSLSYKHLNIIKSDLIFYFLTSLIWGSVPGLIFLNLFSDSSHLNLFRWMICSLACHGLTLQYVRANERLWFVACGCGLYSVLQTSDRLWNIVY